VLNVEQEIPVIYVGKKPLSAYLAQCFDIINSSESEKIRFFVEGMGKNIVKVIDLVNFLKRFSTKKEVSVSDFLIDLVPKKEVHGLPKHVSRLRLLIEISPKSSE